MLSSVSHAMGRPAPRTDWECFFSESSALARGTVNAEEFALLSKRYFQLFPDDADALFHGRVTAVINRTLPSCREFSRKLKSGEWSPSRATEVKLQLRHQFQFPLSDLQPIAVPTHQFLWPLRAEFRLKDALTASHYWQRGFGDVEEIFPLLSTPDPVLSVEMEPGGDVSLSVTRNVSLLEYCRGDLRLAMRGQMTLHYQLIDRSDEGLFRASGPESRVGPSGLRERWPRGSSEYVLSQPVVFYSAGRETPND